MFGRKADVANLKKLYPNGTRVQLLHMKDPQAPPVGTFGTVIGVDDIGSLMVKWDNGSSLNVIYGEDFVKKVYVEEIKSVEIEEKKSSKRI